MLVSKDFKLSKIGKEIILETRTRTPNMPPLNKMGDYSHFIQEFLNHCNNNPPSIMDKSYEPIIDDMNYKIGEDKSQLLRIQLSEEMVETLKSYKEDHGIPMVRIFLATMYFFYTKMPKDLIIKYTPIHKAIPLFLTWDVAELLTECSKKYAYPPSVILKIGLSHLKQKSFPKKKAEEIDGTLNIGSRNYERIINIYPAVYKEFIKLYDKNKAKYYSRVNITEILVQSAEVYLSKLVQDLKNSL